MGETTKEQVLAELILATEAIIGQDWGEAKKHIARAKAILYVTKEGDTSVGKPTAAG